MIALISLSASLATILLRPLVEQWHRRGVRRSRLASRKPVGNWIELVLKVYTAKILLYYTPKTASKHCRVATNATRSD